MMFPQFLELARTFHTKTTLEDQRRLNCAGT